MKPVLNQLMEDVRQEYLSLSAKDQAESLESVKASIRYPAGKGILLFAMTGESGYLEKALEGGVA